jgi:CcmD family protein
MYKIFLRVLFFVSGTIWTTLVYAQYSLGKEKPQIAGLMRSNGKIYVVVAVLLIILTGLFIYLINLDRKLSRLEKEMITKSDPDRKPNYL